jgi:cytochrome c
MRKSPPGTYSVVSWLLYRNGLLPADTILDKASLPKIKMPNRDGFEPRVVFGEPQQRASQSE